MDNCADAKPPSELELLREELHLFKTAGIIEIAVRNSNVASWLIEWENRAIKAEQQLAAARLAGKIEGLQEAITICEGVPLPGGGPFRENPGYEGNWVTDGDTARTRNRCASIIRAKIAELEATKPLGFSAASPPPFKTKEPEA